MEKTYYRISIRLSKWIGSSGEFDAYSIYLYNEGYVIIENNKFFGFLGNDYIEGNYDDLASTLAIQIIDFQDSKKLYLFSERTQDFYLPNSFLLKNDLPNEDKICLLTFEKSIKNKIKQEMIDWEFDAVCQLYDSTK